LMRVPKGFGSFENLTEEKYPEFVDDVDFDSNSDRLVLQYDVAAHGIEIAKTNVTDGTNSNWFFDPRTNGLFKDAYPTDQSIHCATYFHAEDPAERLTVYGCKDGYLRYFDPSAENDDGTAIDSYIDYGPIQLADGEREGIIFSVDAELADGASESDDVTWRLWVDESADDIVKALSDNTSPNLGGTFREGRRRGGSSKRKARGVYAGIKLRNNTSGESWAMEKLLVGVRPAGRLK